MSTSEQVKRGIETKSGVVCDKCHGTGKLTVDPGRKKPSEDLYEVDSTKTAWENDTSEPTTDHCEKCFGEEYEQGTGELKKYRGHDLCYRCFDKVISGKEKFEMSTVAGVAGFNSPMGSTDKKGVKHNLPIEEFDLSDFKTKWDDIRWTATTTQLKQYADRIGVQYSDIPEGPSFKRKLATRMAEKLKIPMKEVKSFKQILKDISRK
jgi:hypothetical protein